MSALDSKSFRALGRKWTARFDFNSAVALEDNDPRGRSFMEIVSPFLVRLDEADRGDPAKRLAAAQAIRFSEIRMILAEALRGAHPDIDVDQVGKICAAIGVGASTEIVAWAIVQALPSPEDDDVDQGGASGDANPPKPTANRKTRRAAAAAG